MSSTKQNQPLSILIVWISILTACTQVATSADQWPADRVASGIVRTQATSILSGVAFTDWVVFWSRDLEKPVTAYGTPVDVGASDREGAALDLVSASVGTNSEFELIRSGPVGRLSRSCFREIRNGLTVLSGRADLTFNRDGRLMRWSLRCYGDWPVSDAHLIDRTTAATALAQSLPDGSWKVDNDRSFAAWYPDFQTRSLVPVHWIRLEGDAPSERWEGIVHAVSGEVILEWPGIQTDQISVTIRGTYWQPYEDSPPQIGAHPFERVLVNADSLLTDNVGHFSAEVGGSAQLETYLRGPYVAVENEDAPGTHMDTSLSAPYPPFNWDWTTEHAVPGELNLYHHTMFIHGWYKILDPNFTALDYPMPAVCNVGNAYDNAFWNGWGTYYGSGMLYNDFAMYSDVIYHEYTHGVTDGIYPDDMLPYTGQPGALNEAWSDYIACSINNDHLMGERMQIGNPNAVFRNLINTMVFPRDWRGEVHADSPFISGALWRIRAVMGAGFTDSLAHYARYALAETFIDYLLAVLETDDDDGNIMNGTPHDRLIYDSFGYHGIGPGSNPHFALYEVRFRADGQGGSLGDGDRFMESGETAALVFDLANDAELYPPPAEDVQIVIASSDPMVTILNDQQSAGQIPAGQVFTTAPFLLQIAPGCANHWSNVVVNVTANQGGFTWSDTLRFAVGAPRLLIVDDDPSTNYESYITDALHSRDRIYDAVALETGENLTADRPIENGLVLWLSGNASGEILSPSDLLLIEQYLTQGGRVVLSGQNIVDDLEGSDFAQNVLQVSIFRDSLSSRSVTATRAPLTPDEWYVTVGSRGANNQLEPSAYLTHGSSIPVAFYGRADTGSIAAVSFANGNGLLFGFGIEAISGMVPGSADLATLLDELLTWTGELGGVCPPQSHPALPTVVSLGAPYPNPFNNTALIPYALPADTRGELVVYDLLGREIESRALPQTQGLLAWSPSLSSGVYFLRLRWHSGQTPPQKILLLR